MAAADVVINGTVLTVDDARPTAQALAVANGRIGAVGDRSDTGMRISLHNDPPVTPEEPLRNISVAATRIAPSGRVLSDDPRAVPPERIADLEVRATFLAGRQVYSQ
jgi:predicted amidohydrolase YtcJ